MPTVILTGATRGIGRAAARRGAELALVGRDPERVRAAVEDARAAGGGGAQALDDRLAGELWDRSEAMLLRHPPPAGVARSA